MIELAHDISKVIECYARTYHDGKVGVGDVSSQRRRKQAEPPPREAGPGSPSTSGRTGTGEAAGHGGGRGGDRDREEARPAQAAPKGEASRRYSTAELREGVRWPELQVSDGVRLGPGKV